MDLHEISLIATDVVLAVDALDAGGAGGWIGTAVVNGVTYNTNSDWKCISGDTHGQQGGGSNVNAGWHGDPPPAGWSEVGFDDSAWVPATQFGANGVGPWGDVNREMGTVDDGGDGTIAADAQWIWTENNNNHNDIYCRLVIPGGCVAAPPGPPAG